MSKRDFGNIKSLVHFDFPYVNEPNDGLGDEIGLESWSRKGNASILGAPKFSWRSALFPDTTSYISGTNAKGTFTLSPSGSYELEAYVNVTAAPESKYSYYGGHTYHLVTTALTQEAARAACEEVGGHLAVINSLDEFNYLCGMAMGIFVVWIDGCKATEATTPSNVTLSDGESTDYSGYAYAGTLIAGENGYDGMVIVNGNSLAGLHQEHTYGYICEWDYEKADDEHAVISTGYEVRDEVKVRLSVNAVPKLTLSIPDWGIRKTSSTAITLNDWEHVVLRITDGHVKLYENGTETMSATITGSAELEPEEVRLGGYVGSMDEFVFRDGAGSENPEVPTKPYSASVNIKAGGGYGNGREGRLTVSTNIQINSYGMIESVSDSKTFRVNGWANGLYAAAKGREVMLHVSAPKSGNDWPELGKYSFGRIASVDGNEVVLRQEPSGDFELTNELLETYFVQAIVMPNLRSLTVKAGAAITPLAWGTYGGGIVAFRVRRDCKIEGAILTHGYGPARIDFHQMENAKMLDRFLISQGGGIYVTCGGRFTASAAARLGASWSGYGDGSNGASGYGGNGGSLKSCSGGYGSVGGGGGGGAMHSTSHYSSGGNAPGGAGRSISAGNSPGVVGTGGGGCGGIGGAAQNTKNATYAGAAGSGGGGQGGSGGAGGIGVVSGNAGTINGGSSVRTYGGSAYRYAGGAGGGAPGGNGGNGGLGSSSGNSFSGGIAGASLVLLSSELDVSPAAISTGGGAGSSNATATTAGGSGGGGTGFCYVACRRQVSDE